MPEAQTTKRTIHVRLLRHEKSGLLAAVSDDLPGLVVHGQSQAEIGGRLPSVIRDLIEADGKRVVSLEVEEDNRASEAGFGLPAFIASAAVTNHRDA